MKTTLTELFMSSALIQGLMALGCVGAIIYLAIMGREVPDVLTAVVMGIIGYYFGTKTQQRSNSSS